MGKPTEETGLAVVEPAATEMALVPNTLPAGFEDGGLEDFGAEDMVTPILKIVQPMSQEGEQGGFFCALTQENYKEIEIVFLGFHKTRVLFEEGVLDQEPLCKSNDNKVPDPSVEAPMSADCKTCPYSQWTLGKDGKQKSPECADVFSFVGLMVDTQFPFLLDVKGLSIKPTKKFLSVVSLVAKTRGVGLWNAKVTIGCDEVKKEKGKAYVIRFSPITWLPGEGYLELAKLYRDVDREASYQAEKDLAEGTAEVANY